MIITTKYDIGQKVKIKDADNWPARIVRIEQDGKDLWYCLEYWRDLEVRSVKLSEEEISA